MSESQTPSEFFWDNTLRIDRLVWLPSVLSEAQHLPDDAKAFLDDWPETQDDILFATLPILRQLGIEEAPEPEQFMEFVAAHKIGGVVFQLARPIRGKLGRHTHYSWGYYHTQWLYAADFSEIIPVAAAQLTRWQASDAAEAAA